MSELLKQSSNTIALSAELRKTLQDIREILHRRGRLSSRNESLDEMCKLLFAHIMSLTAGQAGLSRATVLNGGGAAQAATALRRFVNNSFKTHLPPSLSHEMKAEDFALKLKPQEDMLALEVLDTFDQLSQRVGVDAGVLHGTDVLNDAFGKFLADSFVDEKELGQYLTPTEVVSFMVQLAIADMEQDELDLLCDPSGCSNFGLVLDPSCGVLSFITELLRVLRHRIVERDGQELAAQWTDAMVRDVVVGMDKSERMVRLALTSSALFGLPAAKLHLTNSLARTGEDGELTASLEGQVRLILTNPPFGAEFHGNDLLKYKLVTEWARKTPSKVNSELLFMERYVDWLMPGGRLLAIVPDSVLTNRGLYEDLRTHLADRIELRGVFSLPAVTFAAAGTTTKTSVLYLRKLNGSTKKKRAAFFAVCEDIGFTISTRETLRIKVPTGKNELPIVLREYLSPSDQPAHGRRVSGVEHQSRWDANFHSSLSADLEKRVGGAGLRLRDVAELSVERISPKKRGETFEYIEISDVDIDTCMVRTKTVPSADAPSRARRVVHAGDVLVSTVRPDRRVIGVVQEAQDGAICTTGFAVLRPKGIDSMALAYLLKTDFVTAQIMRNNIGIAYPAIEESCLPDVLLPISREKAMALQDGGASLFALEKAVEEKRKGFREEVERLVVDWTG
ncbi:MAG TPA: N-6 DNA methylase [Pyrinomonadaceae bacterium]|nr:N-6 DNA methylase [Pyrinomonadaceae bacterium]